MPAPPTRKGPPGNPNRHLSSSKKKRPNGKSPSKPARKQKPNVPAPSDVDGGNGWVVLVGAFFVQMLVVGNMRTIGIILVDVQTHYHISSLRTAWVGTLYIGLMFGLAPVSNFLVNKYTYRCTIMTGGFIICLGYFITFFTHRINDMYITIGAIAGIGSGLTLTPSIMMVNTFFSKRRALANGISIAGSGAGNVVLPFIYHFTSIEFGLHGCMLIMAAIFLNISAVAIVFPQPTRKEGIAKFKHKIRFDGIKSDMNIFASTPMLAVLPTSNNKTAKVEMETKAGVSKSLRKDVLLSNMYKVRDNNLEFFKRGRALRRNSSCPDLAAAAAISSWALQDIIPEENENEDELSDPEPEESEQNKTIDMHKFFISVFPMCLALIGYVAMISTLPSRAVDIGLNTIRISLLVSILGIGELISRPLSGFIIDRKYLASRYVFAISIGICGLASVIVTVIPGDSILYIVAAIYGTFGGVVFSLPPVIIVRVFRKDNFNKLFCRCALSMSIGAAFVVPLAGWLRDVRGNWNISAYIASGAMLFSALMSLSSVQLLRLLRRTRKRHRQDSSAHYFT